MTPFLLNWILFVAVVLVFARIGFSSSRRQQSPSDYFHNSSMLKNVVSLTATTITLGTGLVYLVTGATQNGALMLLVPAAVLIGFCLQSWVLGQLGPSDIRTEKNILGGINRKIEDVTGTPSVFAKLTSACLVFVFVLVLAFEIFASSKVISPLLFESSAVGSEILMSLIIFGVTVTYTILGGVSALFNVDKWQAPLIVLFLITLAIVGIPNLFAPQKLFEVLTTTLKLDALTITGIAIACIGAIATQLYSILNWTAVSHVDVNNQQRLLLRVGLLSSAIFVLFVLIGLSNLTGQNDSAWGNLTSLFAGYLHGETFVSYLTSAILLLGMAAILLSTTDAIVIAAIMFWYDNVAGANSKSHGGGVVELQRIRKIGFITFALCFGVLLIINYFQPDPFYLLLSMAGGVTVFAPMIATSVYMARFPEKLVVLTNQTVYFFVSVFVIAGLVDVVLLANRSPLVAYVSAIAFLVSCLASAYLLKKANSLAPS